MPILVSEIEQILREEDIEGFIFLGAPSDEYNSESMKITDLLLRLNKTNWSVEKITDIIVQIWMSSFALSKDDIDSRLSTIQTVAHRILALQPRI